eukprot:GDKI01046401.1.p1 GENE.GDKI01046401.1~~GDKI01046401.1.p1  ORF type:complete len:101 (-),score=5.26 GDKI01046401.1:15-317(-)
MEGIHNSAGSPVERPPSLVGSAGFASRLLFTYAWQIVKQSQKAVLELKDLPDVEDGMHTLQLLNRVSFGVFWGGFFLCYSVHVCCCMGTCCVRVFCVCVC